MQRQRNMVTFTCAQCGAIGQRWPGELAKYRTSYCSKACHADSKRAKSARTLRSRLWDMDCSDPDACWVRTHSIAHNGYSFIHHGGRQQRAHRVAWEIANGRKVGEGLEVAHACDNRPCCNPSHLFETTRLGNERDKANKGRLPTGPRNGRYTKPECTARWEKNGGAKLTWDAVQDIRRRYAAGGISQSALGAEFGVTQVQVSSIVRGKTWREDIVPRPRHAKQPAASVRAAY